MASLAEIRAKLQEAQNRTSGNNPQAVETTQFTHIGTCKKARKQSVRFLPDGNKATHSSG
jgi:hypothetical protein